MELKRNMGSLPNLHELERVRRKLEIEQEIAKREQKAREERESSREPEKLSTHLPQLSHSPHNLIQNQGLPSQFSGICLSPPPFTSTITTTIFTCTTATTTTSTTTIGASFGFTAGNSHYGGYGYVNVGTPNAVRHHHLHRHSLTTRHRVLRTRSSGSSNIHDDAMIEHISGYSPLSSRAHRITAVTPYQVQAALAATRRRESVSSSVGANSIRRLLTLNNRSYCRQKIPPNVRAKVCKNFIFLSVAHGLFCAILIPLIGLQGSNSVWHHQEQWIHLGPNIGSMLLSISFLISCGMCFLTAHLIRKIGYTFVLASTYIGMSIFLACHLYPSIYTLLPAYVLLGMTISPAWIAKLSLIVIFASKISCNQHECNFPTTNCAAIDTCDEHRVFCNRDQKVRRLVRWFQAAQDIGIIIGAVIASIILGCSLTKGGEDSTCFDFLGKSGRGVIILKQEVDVLNESIFRSEEKNDTSGISKWSQPSTEISMTLSHLLPSTVNYIYDMYNHNEYGQRICGSGLCPIWHITQEQAANGSFYASFIHENGKSGGIALIIIYISFALIGLILTFLPEKIDNVFKNERVKGMTDTLIFGGPMAYFIGTEQAYMLADFTRAYVSCTLGLQMVAGALICMGVMQAIVSCTLSMLLRHVKRIVVIAAGFFFHACLLLVLSQWKPSQDDSALFYVIAASWGACNAMWETLLLALVTIQHTNHIPEIVAPLQALRFLGLGITFAAHGFLCENFKIIILGVILFISVPPYAILEIRLEAQRKSQMISL